jgi:hypothetical protein
LDQATLTKDRFKVLALQSPHGYAKEVQLASRPR